MIVEKNDQTNQITQHLLTVENDNNHRIVEVKPEH